MDRYFWKLFPACPMKIDIIYMSISKQDNM